MLLLFQLLGVVKMKIMPEEEVTSGIKSSILLKCQYYYRQYYKNGRVSRWHLASNRQYYWPYVISPPLFALPSYKSWTVPDDCEIPNYDCPQKSSTWHVLHINDILPSKILFLQLGHFLNIWSGGSGAKFVAGQCYVVGSGPGEVQR